MPSLKPRNKRLNDVLMSRPGGRMRHEKDHDRKRDKRELRKMLSANFD